MELSRRGFIGFSGASLAASSIGALGFGAAGEALAASVRPFKLARATETRNTCPIARSPAASSCTASATGRRTPRPASSTSRAIPIIRSIAARSARRARRCSTSCTAPTRAEVSRDTASPAPTSSKRISWDDALDRIARLMKDDRDKNFIAKNADGVTVNRWLTTGIPGGLRDHQRDGVPDLQGRPQRSACWSSTTRRVSDTARRWPVWPRRSAVVR